MTPACTICGKRTCQGECVGWQRIETHQDDGGQWILAIDRFSDYHFPQVVRWDGTYKRYFTAGRVQCHATHWMPIPDWTRLPLAAPNK